ncbi:polysaccharide deacetylase family protein [Cyanobium sp. NIES-981]|uniref:polysaccharide deacetylase family protein n=1 Tax=Cyanobium sp. NIES-981 TaxID=1851505 RepID=UPI0007DDFE20|nr:polysaccharide deacetylase family protein [Cyanobium sp. NIES-981]SBO44884.1 putative Polysaccharide deacetylase [Cyanobium sp. NIES-981]
MLHVLCYHRVVDGPIGFDRWDLSVSRARFERQLRVLSNRMPLLNLSTMSLDEALSAPESYALITFDDIYADVVTGALPLIEACGATALLFVSGAFLDRASFWWDDLEALHQHLPEPERSQAIDTLWLWLRDRPLEEKEQTLRHMARLAGPEPLSRRSRPLRRDELEQLAHHPAVRFGGHTMTHPWLPSLSPAAVEEEIQAGTDLLRRVTGQEPLAFAYPYGAWSDPSRDAVGRLGYGFAFTTQAPPSPPTLPEQADKLAYPRLCVGNWTGKGLASRLTRNRHPSC